jgi:hypothetical protein
MSSQSLRRELRALLQFAMRRIGPGARIESAEDLVPEGRTDAEFAQTLTDVRHGLADKAAGSSEPADTLFADIRHQLGQLA